MKEEGTVDNVILLKKYFGTRPLQNAKVMAREKQGEAAKMVTSMGKNPLKNSLL